MYRSIVLYPKSADPAKVDELISASAASFKASVGSHPVTRNAGPLMGPGAQTGQAGWIFEADFATLDDAMSALDADHFQAVMTETEALTTSIFLFEIADV